MNQARRWILAATLGCFAAGMSVGTAVPGVVHAWGDGGGIEDSDEQYVRDLVADYGLDRAQERSLRIVMQSGQREEFLAFRTADFAALPPQLQARLSAIRGKKEQRIRALLNDTQRAKYDAQARPPANR